MSRLKVAVLAVLFVGAWVAGAVSMVVYASIQLARSVQP